MTKVFLSDGSTKEVDIYIDCTGLHPNNEFIPKTLLDDHGYVVTDDYLRTNIKGIYAVGDIVSNSKRTAIEAGNMFPILAGNILYDLTEGKAGKNAEYHASKAQLMVVPIGRKKGAGILFGWNMFSFLVYFFKGKTFLLELYEKQASGAAF